MKSLEELTKLANNPHYIMNEAELLRLKEAGELPPKKGRRGNATVKVIGVLNKHTSKGEESTHGTV